MYHSPIAKSRESDIAAIQALVKRTENQFVRAFLAYLTQAASDDLLAEVIRLLESSRQGDVPALFEPLVRSFDGVIYDAVIAAARFETDMSGPDIVRIAREAVPDPVPTVGISFNPGNPRAAEVIRNQQSRFIREITEAQAEVIRSAISEGQLAGEGSRKIANRIRENIGLTARQEQAVRNYRRLLEEGSTEALSRDLRDRRTDSSVKNAKEKPLTPAQIDKMVDSYRKKYVQYRAETIARTESAEAIQAGRTEALRQNLEQVGLGDDAVEREWVNVRDKRIRYQHTHSGLAGKKVIGISTPFVAPNGDRLLGPGDRSLGASAGNIVNCRCTVRHKILLPE